VVYNSKKKVEKIKAKGFLFPFIWLNKKLEEKFNYFENDI